MQTRSSLRKAIGAPPNDTLPRLLEQACQLTCARYGALEAFDASGRVTDFFTFGLTPEQRGQMGSLPKGLGIRGALRRDPTPLRLNDLSKHPDYVGFPPGHPPMKTLLAAPVHYKGVPIGCLFLGEKADGKDFTEQDERAAVLLAERAAITIRDARLSADLHDLAAAQTAIPTKHKATRVSPPSGEEYFRLLVHYSLDLVSLISREGAIMYYSPSHERFLGYKEGEMEHRLIFDFVHPDDLTVARKAFRNALKRPGVVPPMEFRFRHKNGSWRVLEAAGNNLLDNPSIGGILINARDVTDRKHAQQALTSVLDNSEKERARLEAVFQASPVAIFVFDSNGKPILVSRAGQRFFGSSFVPDEPLEDRLSRSVPRRPDGTVYTPEERPVLRALRGETVDNEEIAYEFLDGRVISTLASAVPLRSPTGEVTGAILVSTDITDRKRAQDALGEQQRRVRALVETAPVGMVVVEQPTGKIVVANNEVLRILDIDAKPGELLTKYASSLKFLRPDGSPYPPEERPLQRALSKGEVTRAEETIVESRDGRKLPILYSATPLFSNDGEVVAAIAVLQDMTPLEEAEKLRDEFLGMVSHELKTPLTAIKGSAATALGSRRPLDEHENRELFRIIDNQADRLRDLVDNILDMSRIEAGSLSVNPEALDLRLVLEEARNAFTRNGGAQEIKLIVNDGLPRVAADRRRINQVLTNLIGNASKFSPGPNPITIEATRDSHFVTIRIRDRGRGIPSDKLPLLFKKFSQVHEQTGRKLTGSGLGLAICRGIVEAHGGRIRAESEGLGKGATFSFTLPIYVETEPKAATVDTSDKSTHLGQVSRPGARSRILAVDDEPQVLRLVQRVLENAGYQAVTTSDPLAVSGLVQADPPDLLLLDLRLPGASGFDILQQVRKHSGVPVIFLTASDNSDDTVHALNMGADDYITKPFSSSELVARVGAALRRRLAPDRVEVKPIFTLGDLQMNFTERRVSVAGAPVALSATEYKLLYELATHAGLVLTHDQLLKRVWGEEYSGEVELIRSFIRNVRRKLGDDAKQPRYILTEPQVGYRMPKSS